MVCVWTGWRGGVFAREGERAGGGLMLGMLLDLLVEGGGGGGG